MTELHLDMNKTALVVIDMQKGIVGLPCEPYTGSDVLEKTQQLVSAFRNENGFVVLVNVGTQDGKDMLHPLTDEQPSANQSRPADWSVIVPELGPEATDHLVTKHQWGAFFGTDLDLQLRRRGIDTIVMCGIATNIGVETTAREAYQHGYHQVFAEDAMTALSHEQHTHTLKYIFPRIGRIRQTSEIVAAVQK